jgi:hypothetical protein
MALIAASLAQMTGMNAQMIELHRQSEAHKAQQSLHKLDSKLNFEQKLQRIRVTGAEDLVDDLEEFERQMAKNGIDKWSDWYRFFENAWEPETKEWLLGCQQREPGRGLLAQAMQTKAEADWAVVYRFCRAELMRKVGLVFENPGDNAQVAWDQIAFPAGCSWKDIEATLRRLNKARSRLLKPKSLISYTTQNQDDELLLTLERSSDALKYQIFEKRDSLVDQLTIWLRLIQSIWNECITSVMHSQRNFDQESVGIWSLLLKIDTEKFPQDIKLY